MKKVYLTILLTTIALVSTYAQKQSYTWHFGKGAGLYFSATQSLTPSNIGTAVHGLPLLIDGPFSTSEGCFSISDKDGNYLFSSDGRAAYGPNGRVMPNGSGLMGHPSSAQSGIAVPKPGSPDLYYLITAPEVSNKIDGYRYSIVDMAYNHGDGRVIPETKNAILPLGTYGAADASENITAVAHENGRHYWMVAKVNAHYLVWLITEDGISQPVAYPSLTAPSEPARRQGNIKFSPNGGKLAYASNHTGALYHADFDANTGVITNAKYTVTGLKKIYGIEFSPNEKWVYITRLEYPWPNSNNTGLYIIPISDLANSALTLEGQKKVNGITNVQLGPDRRIYGITGGFQYDPDVTSRLSSLWVILNPDEGGTSIAEFKNFFKDNKRPVYGLPPFITSFFKLKGIDGAAYPCISNEEPYDVLLLQGSGSNEIAYIEWDFGDGSPKVKQLYIPNTSTYEMKHKYQDLGTFTITATPYNTIDVVMDKYVLTREVTTRTCTMVVNPASRSFYKPF